MRKVGMDGTVELWEDDTHVVHRKLGSVDGCNIWEEADGRVHFVADADIDADGANGQNGGAVAYKSDDSGSEALKNGGMAIGPNGKVICAHAWARGVVICGSDREPREFPGKLIASCTWYRRRGYAADDPEAYVDAQTVPYIVVPPLVVQKTAGTVRGCKSRVTWKGKSVDCVVADLSSADKIGEMSIAAAEALGINANPRHGGDDSKDFTYELWPGVAATGIAGENFDLEPA